LRHNRNPSLSHGEISAALRQTPGLNLSVNIRTECPHVAKCLIVQIIKILIKLGGQVIVALLSESVYGKIFIMGEPLGVMIECRVKAKKRRHRLMLHFEGAEPRARKHLFEIEGVQISSTSTAVYLKSSHVNQSHNAKQCSVNASARRVLNFE
jgi:hypothetical protein